MPKYTDIKKVLVLGSGPIVIGQAAEFDYAGTQACRALKEEGLEVVLINSNPATIMTDKDIADHVYIEPMNLPSITQIIEKERPDALLPNMGGQTGLNLAMALYENGTLEKYGVRLLGTSPASIHKAEDRQGFKDCMESIGQPCVTSKVVNTVEDAVSFTNEIGYPVIVRPAYTLGGTGGGIAYDEVSPAGDLRPRPEPVPGPRGAHRAVHRRLEGDRVRGHAGLRRQRHHHLLHGEHRSRGRPHRRLHRGGPHPDPGQPGVPDAPLRRPGHHLRPGDRGRLQRAVRPEPGLLRVCSHRGQSPCVPLFCPGLQGHWLPHRQGGRQGGPGLHPGRDPQRGDRQDHRLFRAHHRLLRAEDPRLPFDKFTTASRTLGTQMKATGEVMAIANSFEGALMKAIRSLELNVRALKLDKLEGLYTDEIEDLLVQVTDERLFVVAEALRRGFSPEDQPHHQDGHLVPGRLPADHRHGERAVPL